MIPRLQVPIALRTTTSSPCQEATKILGWTTSRTFRVRSEGLEVPRAVCTFLPCDSYCPQACLASQRRGTNFCFKSSSKASDLGRAPFLLAVGFWHKGFYSCSSQSQPDSSARGLSFLEPDSASLLIDCFCKSISTTRVHLPLCKAPACRAKIPSHDTPVSSEAALKSGHKICTGELLTVCKFQIY